jgi:hypothetical protein
MFSPDAGLARVAERSARKDLAWTVVAYAAIYIYNYAYRTADSPLMIW